MADLVSVIVPCFNYGRYLAECVGSLARQSYSDWECIIVDDGSTDETPAVCDRLAEADSRIRVIRQKNRGLSAARNAGIDVARGQFVQFLDADDLLEREKLTTQVACLQSHPDVDIVFGRTAFFGPGSSERLRLHRREGASGATVEVEGEGLTVLAVLVSGNIGAVNAALVRHSVFDSLGRFDDALQSHEDWDFWLRCALAGCQFAFVSDDGSRALVREHGPSMSRVRETMLTTSIRIRERLDSHLPVQLRPRNRAKLLETKAAFGIELVRQGNTKRGWALYIEAVCAAKWHARPALQLFRLLPGAANALRLGRRVLRSVSPH